MKESGIVPLTLAELNTFVETHHRHHKAVRGHRFSIGLVEGGSIVGACCVGRPVSKAYDSRRVAEVTRLATNGTRNACSALYGAAARAAKAMGFEILQTYTLASETGASLRAAGFTLKGLTRGGQWRHSDGRPRRTDQPTCAKHRWERCLA